MEYVQILPQLFLGSHPQTTDEIERLRQEAGITAVLNLQTDDDMRAVNLVWEPLEAHYQTCGIELSRLPVRDFDPVDLREKLAECVRTLDRLLAASHSVYLHCTAGTGRSPTVAIAYLHWCGDRLPSLVSRLGFGWSGGLCERTSSVLAESGGHSASHLGSHELADRPALPGNQGKPPEATSNGLVLFLVLV